MGKKSGGSKGGRTRDAHIDEAVLAVAVDHLVEHGVEAFSLAAVAAAAGTTRPAIYRRWPGKIALLVDAVASLSPTDPPSRTGSAYTDLLVEAEHYRYTMSEGGGLALAAVMLGEGVDEQLRTAYRERIAGPRRERFREVLTRAVDEGELARLTDVDLALDLVLGAPLAQALVGQALAPDWPDTVVAYLWQA